MPMFKNEYPYTNIHEINLDWIIKNVEEIRALVDKYIINYEQITFADPITWNYAVEYPMHTIVLDEAYNAYLSKQDVPSYTQLGNTDYWLKIGDFFLYIEKALSNLAYNETTRTTASKSFAAGELLINNDILYRATVQISMGTAFEIGVNIQQVTVESLLNELKTSIAANAADIQTNAEAIRTNAGNIAALQTSKQNVLTFDSTPTANSTNPVTSAGIYNMIHRQYGAVSLSHAAGSDVTTNTSAVLRTATFVKVLDESSIDIIVGGTFNTSAQTAGLVVSLNGVERARASTKFSAENNFAANAVTVTGLPAGTYTVELSMATQSTGATATAPAYTTRFCTLVEVI